MTGKRLQHLIVVVPGIGGSVLADERMRPVWGDARRRVVQVLADPGRLSLAEAPTLHPVALMASAGHIPPFRLHGYDGLVLGLRNGVGAGGGVRVDTATPTVPGYTRDLAADVVLFPYDFRYGVAAAGERLAEEIGLRLADLSPRQRARRVIVVGHSMGGLVARYWAGLPGQAGLCRAVLTVGTPHLGAPKALDWVVNGAALGRGPIREATTKLLGEATDLLDEVTRVLRDWPGVYDLLPTYRAVLDETGGGGVAGDPALLPADLVRRLGVGYVADPAFASRVAAAAAMHEEISRTWSAMDPDVRPAVVPFLARDHGTPNAVYLRGGRLVVTDDDPHWQPNAGWRGDGTVPAISAVPSELQGRREVEHPVTQRHTPMASAGSVVQVVRALTGDSGPVRGDETFDARVRLGVDLDEAAVLGEPVPVRARLIHPTGGGTSGLGPQLEGIALSLLVKSADRSVEALRVPMALDGDGWAADFTPSARGAWRVTVEVTGLSGQAAPRAEDILGVIDPEDPTAVDDGSPR